MSGKAAWGLSVLDRAFGVGFLASWVLPIDQPERERWLIQAARVTVPIVTDPKAVLKLTGL